MKPRSTKERAAIGKRYVSMSSEDERRMLDDDARHRGEPKDDQYRPEDDDSMFGGYDGLGEEEGEEE